MYPTLQTRQILPSYLAWHDCSQLSSFLPTKLEYRPAQHQESDLVWLIWEFLLSPGLYAFRNMYATESEKDVCYWEWERCMLLRVRKLLGRKCYQGWDSGTECDLMVLQVLCSASFDFTVSVAVDFSELLVIQDAYCESSLGDWKALDSLGCKIFSSSCSRDCTAPLKLTWTKMKTIRLLVQRGINKRTFYHLYTKVHCLASL